MSRKKKSTTEDEKKRIVFISYKIGVSKTSQMYNISPSTIYKWRKSPEIKIFIEDIKNIKTDNYAKVERPAYSKEMDMESLRANLFGNNQSHTKESGNEFIEVITFIPWLIWNTPRLIKKKIKKVDKTESPLYYNIDGFLRYLFLIIVILIFIYLALSIPHDSTIQVRR